jgi:esterase
MTLSPADYRAHLGRVVALSRAPVGEIVLPSDQQVILNGQRFHYLDWGESEKPPIVFLHGSGLTAHTWDVMALSLRDEFHCLAFDLRGHGESEWSPGGEYDLDSFVRDVEAFLELLSSDEVTLVGMSLGGTTAIRVAARNRTPLKSLVIVDIAPRLPPLGSEGSEAETPPSAAAQFMALPSELDSVEAFVERAMEFNPRRDPTILRISLLHNLRQLPSGKWTWRWDRRHREPNPLTPNAPRPRATWEEVESITCPTLLVRGERSLVLSPEAARKFLETIGTGRFAEISGAGHTIQGDNPAGLLIAMRAFFSEFHVGRSLQN